MPEAPKPGGPSVRVGYDRWSEIYDQEANPLVGLEEPVVREGLHCAACVARVERW